ncbi:hypothetical protein SETIT_1G120400v2 [Setaria italica]|uniref:Uncharacterized protein n=1 Tax=Setaria italica TaxID=4555 RepID=A0A368PJT4_SETIT|nr:hypothetical protein SETIT_1G120400v2 [Setaria italica]
MLRPRGNGASRRRSTSRKSWSSWRHKRWCIEKKADGNEAEEVAADIVIVALLAAVTTGGDEMKRSLSQSSMVIGGDASRRKQRRMRWRRRPVASPPRHRPLPTVAEVTQRGQSNVVSASGGGDVRGRHLVSSRAGRHRIPFLITE